MGCGTCCGSGVSAFLFGYLTSHAGSLKHSFRAFLSFYLGKVLAVACVCVACSLLGRQILDENGNLGSVNIHTIVNLLMIAMGVWFIIKWVRERLHPGCEHCHHCSAGSGKHRGQHVQKKDASASAEHSDGNASADGSDGNTSAGSTSETTVPAKNGVSHLALAGMGAGYGISPCAPLIMMAGYAATLAPAAAFLTGCVFAAASAFVPMLLLMLLTGVLSAKLYKEIPQYIGIFRLISYIVLIVVFAVTL